MFNRKMYENRHLNEQNKTFEEIKLNLSLRHQISLISPSFYSAGILASNKSFIYSNNNRSSTRG
jgi:hypothetical protein